MASMRGSGQEVRGQRDEGTWRPWPWAPTWQVNQKEEVRLSETRLKMVFSEPRCGETEGSGDGWRGRLRDGARACLVPPSCALAEQLRGHIPRYVYFATISFKK